ncbi:replicative DNA helicase [Luteolibacter soli]|uniref:DNA 5'-3' helicase n=1 Tax=Luteolibacter soli TaxID=3135280 RepID=A0ABU9AZ56_9BACT
MSEIPQSPITERTVLSLMARDESFRRRASADGLDSDHFYACKPIFDAITELARNGEPVDEATLSASLEHSGQIMSIGGHIVISDLFRETTGGRAWAKYLKDLRMTHAMRIQRDGLAWATDATTTDEALEALESTREAMRRALAGPTRSKTMRQVMAELMEEMKRLAAAGPIPGISTGMDDLDAATGGLKDGSLWTVLAQTSRGKSVLMLQIACAALKAGYKVAFFSVEMMTIEIGMRAVSNRGKIPMELMTQPRRAKKLDLQAIENQIRILVEETCWVNDTPGMSLAYIEREACRLADENDGLDLVVVDYLQILKAERNRNQNREEAVAGLSNGLKQLAKKLNCPVLTGSQVNKKGDSRESDAILFDSDVALMIGDDGIKLAKVRNGPKDVTLHYRLNGAVQAFQPFTPPPPEEAPPEVVNKQADQWKAARKGRTDKQFKK